jgi:hypothetical protein
VIQPNRCCLLAVLGTLLLLTACGGSNDSPAASLPSNSTTPPIPAVSWPVFIFANPSPQTYAMVGSSATGIGGYAPVAPDARLTNISLDAANQPQLRYVASTGYELQLPGGIFDVLGHYKGLSNPTSENTFFQPLGALQNEATFIVSRSRLDGYAFSERASWSSETAPGSIGFVAFGSPTPAATTPTSGSASFQGQVFGIVDITYFDGLYGGTYFTPVSGTVTLAVDFATRAIEGTLEIDDPRGTTSSISVPLTATTFLPGDDTFSGLFETSQSGFNEFRVKLMGPEASELIGSWAVPILIDGNPHQLMGAWIAARG